MRKQGGKLFVLINGAKLFTQTYAEILLAESNASDTGGFFRGRANDLETQRHLFPP
jgi:hypothetical protein